MPPKGGNAKKETGRAKKAENEEKKAQATSHAKEAKEADEWKSGAKGVSKGEVSAVKQAEAARKKAEREALLAAEEASLPAKTKSAPKAGSSAKKKPADKPLAVTGMGVAGFTTADPLGLRKGRGTEDGDGDGEATGEISATGLEQMLEAMEVVNQRTDKQSLGMKAGLIEQHPERRFKAAFQEYLDREIPKLREEHPGLRQNQMRDKLFKQFEKAPENPFNQAKIAYNASRDDKVDALKQIMDAREAKYKTES